ncbi:hypothetical protein BDN72DRAFT_835746 [Pluteus cervinus]|uniref:Uncharacterized protein n=1 Tax=Pluteus cervinus TaxID=181527 RepID=A0ACD3B4G2_9AGAR|nr:hypothetical protein BDN72DRAFT_835746 [Pluteus cervinus]
MSKRTTFTSTTPLPLSMTREAVVAFLHDYDEMISLNPLVTEYHRIEAPSHAAPDELDCVWYSVTDKISYLPGGLITGHVTYTVAFDRLPNGIQSHCYAPAGVDLREKWTLNGTLPGEPPEPVQLGAPGSGLYMREDVDMRCNLLMSGFVKKTLKKAHATLVDRIKDKIKPVPVGSQPPQARDGKPTSAGARPRQS